MPSTGAERRAAPRRRAAVCAAAWLVVLGAVRPAAPVAAQPGVTDGGAYPSPGQNPPPGQNWIDSASPPIGANTPGWPPPFGVGATAAAPGDGGFGLPTSAAPAAGVGDAATPDAAAGPVRIALTPPFLALESGGRAVTVVLQGATVPIARIALDLRFNADHFAVTALTPDPALTASGAQLEFKHRIEPGRLRLSLSLSAAEPSLLPSGSAPIAQITFAAITAGSGELTLEPATSSIVAGDGSIVAVELDAPAMLQANDGAVGPLATQVAAARDALIAQSAPASEMGAGGGGVARLARDILATLRGALGGVLVPGGLGGDDAPFLAWLAVVVGALCVTGLGYMIGRTPVDRGPRRPRRFGRRGGVVLEHDVIESERERR